MVDVVTALQSTPSPLHPYPDLAGFDAAFESAARALGAEVFTYGTSVQGRPLRGALIGEDDAAPVVALGAMIHGIEYIAGQVALGVLAALADAERGFLDEARVLTTPCINPDGYARCSNESGAGRVRDFRKNARGVDLNRNWPRPTARPGVHLPFQGSDSADAPTYRGAHPLSEPETAALDALLAQHRPHAACNLHSFMGRTIPPRVPTRGQHRSYAALCRAFARAQARFRYGTLSSYVVDSYTGEQEDHQHAAHQTWAVCVESFPLAHSFRAGLFPPTPFWRFNPKTPATYVDNDVPGIFGFWRAALALGRAGPAV